MCGKCKEAHVATDEEIRMLMEEYSLEMLNTQSWKKDLEGERAKLLDFWMKEFANENGKLVIHSAKGCDTCGGTGYKGRTAICELLDLTDPIRELILERRPTSEVKRAAHEEGMRFLRESAVEKVLTGLTTLREINKVTFIDQT